MQIYFLKEEVLNQLKADIKKNMTNYENSKKLWVEENSFIKFSKIFLDFKLDMSEKKPSDTDVRNIILVYSNLKELKDNQALDERLWAGLCHNQFWEYLRYRWPVEKDDSNPRFIEQHYFFGDDHPIFFNGLSRLWWIGRLTYDENLKDPFELTKYLCQDWNGRGYPLFSVNFSNNKELIRTFLKTLMEFEKKRKLSRQDFEKVKKIMVLWGGKIILDSLSEEELSSKIKNN